MSPRTGCEYCAEVSPLVVSTPPGSRRVSTRRVRGKGTLSVAGNGPRCAAALRPGTLSRTSAREGLRTPGRLIVCAGGSSWLWETHRRRGRDFLALGGSSSSREGLPGPGKLIVVAGGTSWPWEAHRRRGRDFLALGDSSSSREGLPGPGKLIVVAGGSSWPWEAHRARRMLFVGAGGSSRAREAPPRRRRFLPGAGSFSHASHLPPTPRKLLAPQRRRAGERVAHLCPDWGHAGVRLRRRTFLGQTRRTTSVAMTVGSRGDEIGQPRCGRSNVWARGLAQEEEKRPGA